MNRDIESIRIWKRIDSETLNLPELRSFIGETVEIVVRPERTRMIRSGTNNWAAMAQAAAELADYDFDAWQRQREFDLNRAVDNLP